ncbi:hypothetical protein L873DRAFT_1805683 [Choiromyces venosus 120613-1]|uniref:Uncharacterized protein n=1 Tax=Choiromyces venosus 120613-1 TaxID=1336337 RepID=A0A3N4JPL3_9PEZI|nr:hypothetical protein L873DRAFT_1805683 [Choiromyces venosus 120613-1]
MSTSIQYSCEAQSSPRHSCIKKTPEDFSSFFFFVEASIFYSLSCCMLTGVAQARLAEMKLLPGYL